MKTKIELSRVTRVYSGRPGCMCGCRGKYYDARGAAHPPTLRMMKKVVDILNNNIENVNVDDDGNTLIYSLVVGPSRNRTYVAYVMNLQAQV